MEHFCNSIASVGVSSHDDRQPEMTTRVLSIGESETKFVAKEKVIAFNFIGTEINSMNSLVSFMISFLVVFRSFEFNFQYSFVGVALAFYFVDKHKKHL